MSGLLVSSVLDSSLPSWVKPYAVALASFGADDGTKVYPSIARVAKMAGRSERQAFRAVRILRGLGVLEPMGRAHPRAPVQYHFHAGRLPKGGDPEQLGMFSTGRGSKHAQRKRTPDGKFSTVSTGVDMTPMSGGI